MAAGRRIPVTVEADTKGDFDKAADGLDKVARKADDAEGSFGNLSKGSQALDAEISKTADSVKSLRAEFERTGDVGLLKDASKLDNARKGLERLRATFVTTATDASDGIGKTDDKVTDLDTRLRTAKDAVQRLGEEFVRTRDVDVLAKLRTATQDVKDIEKLGKAVERVVSDARTAGEQAGKTFMAELQGDLSNPVIGPPLTAVLVGAAIAASPAIGAAIGAGVTLGVGGGVLAGGILLAAKDPAVQAAWGQMGNDAKDQLTSAAAVFGPSLVRASHTFGAAFSGQIMPSIRADFQSLEPLVDRLAVGVAGFASNMMPGVDKLVETAGPFLRDLAAELPNLGNAMSDFFSSVSAGGPGALQFFHDLVVWTEKGIVGVGNLIEVLSKGYAVLSGVGRLMTGDVSGAITLWDQFGDKGKKAAENLNQVGDAAAHAGLGVRLASGDFSKLSAQINATREDSDTLAGQMVGKVFNSMMSLDQATLGFARSQTSLGDSIKQNGLDLDIHTAKGEANRGAILAAVQANMAAYQANISVGMAAGDAAKAYDDNTAALERQLQKAGLTQGAIDGLIGKYRGVPAKVDTDIATNGLTAAINGLEDAIRLANHLNGRVVTMTVEEQHRTTYTNDIAPSQYGRGNRWGGAYEHAQVGLLRDPAIYSAVSSGARYAFAEPATGGEAFIPKNGDPGRSMGILSQAASWYGAGVVPRSSGYASPVMAGGGGAAAGGGGSQMTVTFAGNTDGAFATAFMLLVRTGAIQLQTS